jgi:hypothetical protein
MFSSDWQFISDNHLTSKEVFMSIFKQRIDEGFVFISPFKPIHNVNTSHFIKII